MMFTRGVLLQQKTLIRGVHQLSELSNLPVAISRYHGNLRKSF